MGRSFTLWGLWFVGTAGAAGVLVAGMLFGGTTQAHFLIGQTTSGHHQIELSCGTCHTTAFGGKEEIEKACKSCHAKDLQEAKDSHPIKKFRDPRNADRLAQLAANKCITCHTEHKPQITNAMGVTLPTDYCARCHQDVGENRPSHKDLAFNTCATAGCHNYHDNTALYEDFLEKHAAKAWLAEKPVSKLRAEKIEIEAAGKPLTTAAQADAPPKYSSHETATTDWLASSHAAAGVNCSGCHAPNEKDAAAIAAKWVEKPAHQQCATCHESEVSTWLKGKHGMRLAEGLRVEQPGLYGLFKEKRMSPMRPELARASMRPDVGHATLNCASCHTSHSFKTQEAQVEACLTCHNDDHSKAYRNSKHYQLWLAERSGQAEMGTGVTCASCHMPRQWVESGWDELLIANHNQSANLRPNEKMLRSVCMDCHGLGFAIDALADRSLIKRNFEGRPSTHVESIDWVMKRVKERQEKRKGN